jgi:F-type H+-transporting ATPase subunit a
VNAKTWAVVVISVLLLGVGFVFFRGATPPLPLPSETLFHIGPWGVRNTIVDSWTVIALLVLVSWLATRRTSLVPVRGLQNFVEAVIEWLLGVVEEVAGEKNARRFLPLVGTIFLYVVVANWFAIVPFYYSVGLIRTPDVKQGETAHAAIYHKVDLGPLPFAFTPLNPKSVEVTANPDGTLVTGDGTPVASLTTAGHKQYVGVIAPFFRSVFSDANAPLSIALVSFFAVEYWGISSLGVGTYLNKFFNFKKLLQGNLMDGLIDAFVGFLELISEFVRIVSFTFRLLGNTFAADTLFIFITFLVPFFIPMVFYGLDLFDGFIQGAIFSLLTLVFAVMAVEHHAETDQHGELELEPA